ncbi:hypothetical protein BASA60_003331 [Batrachochytrium salamandrivorans]|nr:hypothetical protein BASA60_003331 [Batrachochytrium salamandrivorans]
MKHSKPYPIPGIGWLGVTSQFNPLPQDNLGDISTMWIDTAGTLPAKSQLTVSSSARLSCLVPIDSCSTVPSNQRWSRSASPFKTPPRSQTLYRRS